MAVELILRHIEATEWAGILILIRDMPADGPTGGRLNGRIQSPCFLEAARLAGRTCIVPRVTVVTPNYNHARYLPQRLDSILNQTFRDFELIILDNASTDNSREVIESYTKDPRVRTIFNAENNGSTFKQWNLGLKHANGEYIWFAEADDYADPTLLKILVDRLDRHASVGLAYCQSWAIDADGNLLHNFLETLEQQKLHDSLACRLHQFRP